MPEKIKSTIDRRRPSTLALFAGITLAAAVSKEVACTLNPEGTCLIGCDGTSKVDGGTGTGGNGTGGHEGGASGAGGDDIITGSAGGDQGGAGAGTTETGNGGSGAKGGGGAGGAGGTGAAGGGGSGGVGGAGGQGGLGGFGGGAIDAGSDAAPDANPVDAAPDASPPCEAGMLNALVNAPTTFEALWLRPDPNDPSIFEVKNTTPFLGGGAIDTQNGILLADQGALEADIAMVQVKDNPVVNPGDPSPKFVTVNTSACTVSCEVIVLNQITALPLNGPGGYLDYASKPAIDYIALPDSDQKNNVFNGGYSLGAANATSNLYRCRITK